MRAATPILCLLISCGGSSSGTQSTREKPAGDGGAAQAGAIAPRPFTAEQIRASMPVGTEIRFRLEEAGKTAVVLHWRVTAADQATTTISSRVLAEDGSVVAEEPPRPSRWQELAEHASFPADRTVRRAGSVTVPAGTFDSIDYVVTDEKDGSVTVSTFRFARQLPGPPVSLTVEKDGATVRKMILLERSSAPLP